VITVRNYQPADRQEVLNVLIKTGYMGEDASSRFDDIYLFGLLFCLYYVDYEPDNCFVAVDSTTNQVVGYILSTLDSIEQKKIFTRKIVPKIFFRLFFYTIWRYRKSYQVLMYMRKMDRSEPEIPNLEQMLTEFPAHLHIDILPDYHRQGIGTKLIAKLESHLRNHKCPGVHLGTSEQNTKAIPFYEAMGFTRYYTYPSGYGMWPDASEVRGIIFTKRID
jgi:ribosomal protein S18 acetylase RimI-like enzyme